MNTKGHLLQVLATKVLVDSGKPDVSNMNFSGTAEDKARLCSMCGQIPALVSWGKESGSDPNISDASSVDHHCHFVTS